MVTQYSLAISISIFLHQVILASSTPSDTSVTEKQMAFLTPLPVPQLILALSLSIPLMFCNAQTQQPTTLTIDANYTTEASSSLQYHLCGLGTRELASNTILQLSGGIHHLEEGPFCLLQNLKNFTIQGQQTQPKTVIYCHSETEIRRGIAFFNISSLHLSHLEIVNCGREIPSGLPGHINNTFVYLGPLQKAVLIISHSTDLIVNNVLIHQCLGFGLLFINPMRNAVIRGLSVTETTSLGLSRCGLYVPRRDMLCAGSGVVVIFYDTDITEELVKISDNYKVSLSINNCTFVNNTNWIYYKYVFQLQNIFIVAYNTERLIMTGGLSLAVYTGQRSYFADVKISDTSIISNTGDITSIFVVYYNTVRKSTIRLEKVTISDNRVTNGLKRGAGMMAVVIMFLDSLNTFPQLSQRDIYDLIEISDSNFTNNSAYGGGALMFYMTQQNVSNVRMVVRNTIFADNVAVIGSALYAFQFPSLVDSKGIHIYMEDVVASGNTFPEANISENPRDDSGVFIASHCSNITLVGTKGKGCIFQKNDVSVFTAVRTNVILRGQMTFEDNHGYRGGALSLIDSSVLFIHNSSNIHFTRNTAFREGGAIYANTLGSSISFICAIQFLAEKKFKLTHKDLQLLDLSIVFSNNSALIAGNSIFGNPLYYCLFIPTSSIDHGTFDIHQALLYNEVFDFKEKVGNQLSELNSVEVLICLCSNVTISGSYCPRFYSLDHPIIPGGTFHLFINSIDFVRTPVASLLYSFPRSANSSDHVELDVSQAVRPLPGLIQCTLVEFTIFAPENVKLFIDLFAVIGGIKVVVEVNTTSCPPGFVVGSSDSSSGRLHCLCSEFIETMLESTCNLTEHSIARPRNFWVGTKTIDSGSTIIQFASTCPINYCKDDMTNIDLRVSNQLCMEGRTGTLCGSCTEGLSSVFGTAECRKCSNAWLATLLLFALIGALMVISAFLLDLTITHGLINGLFFYSNIVMVNANILFQGNQRGFLFWFLSWVNLDIGFPLCFYDGMTESAKVGLQYVFPTYIIAMIVFIITVGRYSTQMQRLISQHDGIHVLVSMFYISFLKLFRTVIDTFTFVTIVSEGEKDDIVWFFDGTQEISDPISIFLVLLGSVTLAGFILPYVIFFTFSTYIQRWVKSTRLSAYVDASLAPYRDKLRFWFGARLILTSVIYIIIANRGTNNPTLSLTLELSLLVGFSIIQAYIHPFKSIGVALLDLSFFINLIALILGTLYTIQNGKTYYNHEILGNFSLSVMFLTNVIIILWHLLRKLHNNKRIRDKVPMKLIQGLKLEKLMAKVGRRAGDGGVTGGLQSDEEFQTGYFKLDARPVAPTTTLHLQDMIAAPDNNQPKKPSTPQPELREPVLGYIN